MSETKHLEFKVVLDGLVLTAEQQAKIEKAIRAAAMRQVARIDNHGDLQISPLEDALQPQGAGGSTSKTTTRGARIVTIKK